MTNGGWRIDIRQFRYSRMQAFLRLLLGLVILSFAAGSTSAALACVEAPGLTAAASMAADCTHQPTKMNKHDSASACVPMCAAMTPAAASVAAPMPMVPCKIFQTSHAVLAWGAKPEPPPPRAG